MPPKKDHPRNELMTVSITALDLAAIEDEAVKRKKSASTIAYEMMLRGSLRNLVSTYVAAKSANLPTNQD